MNWDRIKKSYVHHRALLSRGHSELSLLIGSAQLGLLIWLTVRDAVTVHREWAFIIVPILVAFMAALQWATGWFMNRTKIIQEIQSWDLERSPQICELLEKKKAEDEAEFWMKTE